MKLIHLHDTNLFHIVHIIHKIDYYYYRLDCKSKKNIDIIKDCCLYPIFHNKTLTKDNICKICFQENKKEIVFLLTKIKLGI